MAARVAGGGAGVDSKYIQQKPSWFQSTRALKRSREQGLCVYKWANIAAKRMQGAKAGIEGCEGGDGIILVKLCP